MNAIFDSCEEEYVCAESLSALKAQLAIGCHLDGFHLKPLCKKSSNRQYDTNLFKKKQTKQILTQYKKCKYDRELTLI